MKRSTQLIVAALTAVGMSLGAAAHAARGDGACNGAPGMSGKSPADYMSGRLEKLHGELKLNTDQEAAWKNWTSAMQEKVAKMRDNRPDREAMAKLPAPERMASMLERHKARQQEMESGLASLREFYGKLTPEQQQVFDRFQPFGGHRRDGGGYGPRGRAERG